MSFSATPPTARTDVHATPQPSPSRRRRARTRVAGTTLAAGATASAIGAAVAGYRPETEAEILTNNLTGLAFQCGLLALVGVHLATRATGTGRLARRLLQVELVLLLAASVWSLGQALLPGQRDATWMAVLDVTWPLSMLGMLLIGVTIAVKGRWRGAPRAWSLVAETWVVVTVPALGVLGDDAGTAVGAAHMLLGYGVLGVLLAARPDRVADRESDPLETPQPSRSSDWTSR